MKHQPERLTQNNERAVTLAEAKLHLRVEHDDDDSLITDCIAAAEQRLDGYIGTLSMALMESQWRQRYDSSDIVCADILLPFGPVSNIDEVSANGQAIPSEAYEFVNLTKGPCVRFDSIPLGSLVITFTAGYANPNDVPAPIKQAMKLDIASQYEYREADSYRPVKSIRNYEALLSPIRRWRI